MERADVYDTVVLTAPDGKAPMPTQLLPRHCVQFTWGARTHEELVVDESSDLLVVQGTRAEVGSFSALHRACFWLLLTASDCTAPASDCV